MKTYFNPTTETVEIETKWALCQTTSQDNENTTGVGGGDTGRNAPERRVF